MRINANKDIEKYILIVDDEEVNREILGHILDSDYQIEYASDGHEALKVIRELPHMPSLVLLDILMPEMNGYEVLKEITSDPVLQKIPVVVLTSDKEAEIESLRLGAADFLTKPYDQPEVILARVRHAIALYENSNLIHAIETDSLTGLYNREFFFAYCEQYDRLHPGVEMDAIVFNINRFHMLNIMYGRQFGNKVLRALSDRLRQSVMDLGGMACRYDADCFYAYIPHTDDYDALFDSIVSGINGILKDGGSRIRMGINPKVTGDGSIEVNFGWALQACNLLRDQAGTHYAFYDDEMHNKRTRQATILDEFERALEEKQFRVFYQPKFNITGDTPRLSSAEALIRWVHPVLGMIDSGEYISLFEEKGFIFRLDRYIWTEVARQIVEWNERFGVYVPVSVNVSRMDIYDPEITSFLADLVADHDIPDGVLMLEVTESAYTDNIDRIVDVVSRLRSIGFRIEMDDFGSGYSSLNMISTLPIDVIKIDKEFMKNIDTDETARKIVELVIDIADFIKKPVIAEGVETEAEYKVLKALGCGYIQGHYFSKALPAEEMTALIMEKKDDLG